MKKILPLFVLFLATAFNSLAQHTVSGIVSDKEDITILHEGVTVYIPELNKSDISKEGGTYIITNVGVGTMHIRFSKEGYRTVIRTINTTDSAIVVSVELERSIPDPEVTTQTSFHNGTAFNSVLPVKVYSLKELDKNGAQDPLSALAFHPETEVITDGPGNTHLSIHGSGINRVGYFVEGVRLENNFWDDYYSSAVNFNGTENLEIINGAASAVYGSGASFGAIVLQEERAAITGKKSGDVKLKFNSNTVGLGAEAGFKGSSANGLFYSLRAGGESQASYIQGLGVAKVVNTEERPFASNSKFNSSNVKASIGLNKKWGMSKLSFSTLSHKNGLITIPEEAQNLVDGIEREREISIPYQEVKSTIFSSNSTIFAGRSLFAIDLSYQTNANKTFRKNFAEETETTDGLDINAYNFNVRYSSNSLKKYSYSIGLNGRSKEVKNKGTFSRIPDATETGYGAFVNLNYKLDHFLIQYSGQFVNENMELNSYRGLNDTTALRPQIPLKKDYSSVNSAGSVSYQPVKFLTFKAGAAMGTETPDYSQLANYALNERWNRFVTGNTTLKQENNLQIDMNVKIEFPAVVLELRGFSNMIKNYIYAFDSAADTIIPVDSNSTDTFNVFTYGQSDATINGFESVVTINPPDAKWIKLELSYSKLNGKFKNGGFLPDIPSDKITAALTFSSAKMNYLYKPFFTVAGRSYAEKKNIALSEKKNDSYILLDCHLGGSFRWGNNFFDLVISANNILNTNYFNSYSLLRNLGTAGVYDMGRNVSVGLHVPFGLSK